VPPNGNANSGPCRRLVARELICCDQSKIEISRTGCLCVFALRAAFYSLRGAVIAAICGMPAIGMAIDPGIVKPSAAKNNCTEPEPILQSYEPITGGYTYDSNDTGFLDVNLSVKIRLLPCNVTPSFMQPYLAMATRFGFYWGTRDNSPVIGKSYNPLILLRFLPTREKIPSPNGRSFERAEYVDVVPYAHESNGQLIHTPEQYNAELQSLKIISYTNNFIHRGWDYAGIAWKKTYTSDITMYLEGRYFIPDGFLQGPADEYHLWENNPQGKPRRAVDGLSAVIEYPSSYAHFPVDSDKFLSRPNLTVKYLTGYDTPFRYSTERVELGFQVFSLPLAVWIQHGYMSSLAMYYEKVTSSGIELRFESF
jgi:hypothetical protein